MPQNHHVPSNSLSQRHTGQRRGYLNMDVVVNRRRLTLCGSYQQVERILNDWLMLRTVFRTRALTCHDMYAFITPFIMYATF